jgi:hypothetical protein
MWSVGSTWSVLYLFIPPLYSPGKHWLLLPPQFGLFQNCGIQCVAFAGWLLPLSNVIQVSPTSFHASFLLLALNNISLSRCTSSPHLLKDHFSQLWIKLLQTSIWRVFGLSLCVTHTKFGIDWTQGLQSLRQTLDYLGHAQPFLFCIFVLETGSR